MKKTAILFAFLISASAGAQTNRSERLFSRIYLPGVGLVTNEEQVVQYEKQSASDSLARESRRKVSLARTNSYSIAELEAMGIQLRAREVLTLDYNPSPETDVMVVRRRWVLCSDPIDAPVFLVRPFDGLAFTNNVFIGTEQFRKMNSERAQKRKQYLDSRK